MVLRTLSLLEIASSLFQRSLSSLYSVLGFPYGLVIEVFGAYEGHVAFEITGRPGVLAFEEGNDFFLRGGLLFESSIEGFLGGVDCKTASFNKLLCVVLEMPAAKTGRMHTLFLDLPPQSLDA